MSSSGYILRTLHDLLLGGQVVGKRVALESVRSSRSLNSRSFSGRNERVYDIDLDTYNLIVKDFGEHQDISGHPDFTIHRDTALVNPLPLVLQGEQYMVPSDKGGDAPTMQYDTVATLLGYSNMQGTDTQLKLLYNQYNQQYFGGVLPTYIGIKWNPRLSRTWGRYRYRVRRYNRRIVETFPGRIELSSLLRNRTPEEFRDVLLHEMIHVRFPGKGHGAEFKGMMHTMNNQHGFNISVYCSESLDWRYEYRCDKCGHTFTRMKRLSHPLHTYYCPKKVNGSVCRGSIVLSDVKEDV
jgi:predicted SprT family Zn-dependent metalloprotease